MQKLKLFLQRNQFEPGIIGPFINPFYIARKGLLKHIKSLGKNISGKTLDVGCGTKPYEKYFHSTEYIGLEIETTIHQEDNKADVFYKGGNFPFQNEEFDSLVTNQVLEHVFEPDLFLSELRRVLKPGGILLLTVPFTWDEHEQPYDYARYSSFGLKHLLETNGFEIVAHIKSENNIKAIFQLLNAYIYKLSKFNKIIKIVSTLIIMGPLSILGILLNLVIPSNNDFYLDNIILAKKI
jgi:SAM-dependent methyltransferase